MMAVTRYGWMFLLYLVYGGMPLKAQPVDLGKTGKLRLEMYLAEGLDFEGRSTQNTSWNKITQTPDGKVWFSGGDHWGIDDVVGEFDDSDKYKRPWGFGNTAICSFDPSTGKVTLEFELDRASAIYSNAETPGHGKIHGNLVSDSKGFIYTAGYQGMSYLNEYTRAGYPKSYEGGALIRYDPRTKDVDYFGIPCPYGAVVALYYDEQRNILNGLSVDRAKFWRLNLTTMELNRYESVARMSRLNDRVREMIMDRDGFCYFANDVGGLTKFNPDTEVFTDIDIILPGKVMDFRASVVSSDNMIYAITTDGFVWSYEPRKDRFRELGHVIGMPAQGHYTPNIALDEEWGRLYFIAGNHGGPVLEEGLELLTILDLKFRTYYWVGQLDDLEGCFGSLVSKDHTVYFGSFGKNFRGNELEKDKRGRPITRPYLIRYQPPEDLSTLKCSSGKF